MVRAWRGVHRLGSFSPDPRVASPSYQDDKRLIVRYSRADRYWGRDKRDSNICSSRARQQSTGSKAEQEGVRVGI